MGREGRVKSGGIFEETSSLSLDEKVALARSQIRSLPYSRANSDEARVRLNWALEQGDLGVFGVEELRLIAGFLDVDALNATAIRQPGLLIGLLEHATGDTVDPELLSVLPQAVKERLCDPYFRRNLASETNTPLSILGFLAKDPDYQVRELVARNPQTSSATILESLARDDQWKVRWRAAENPHTSAATLEVLAKDPAKYVRKGVAQNLNTAPSVLEVLAADE
jgi:hypothetical protein